MKKNNTVPGFEKSNLGWFWLSTGFELPIDIKTIDINCLEWWRRGAGGSYHSSTVTINFGMPDQCTILLPMQGGSGENCKSETLDALKKLGLQTTEGSLWQYCRQNGVILRYNIEENCRERDLFRPKH